MNLKKLALPVLVVAASVGTANAAIVPTNITPIVTNTGATANVPTTKDYFFLDNGLTASVNYNVSGGYTLTVLGKGNMNFMAPNGTLPGTAYSSTLASFYLTANFTQAGVFQAAGSGLTITGLLNTPSGLPSGVTPVHNPLYSANLTGFGYNFAQDDIAFTTQFNPSWSNQPVITGGSTGESVYLGTTAGWNASNGTGPLAGILTAFQNHDLSQATGQYYTGFGAITVVPVPMPAVLFGTGLTALLGMRRQRRSIAA